MFYTNLEGKPKTMKMQMFEIRRGFRKVLEVGTEKSRRDNMKSSETKEKNTDKREKSLEETTF